MEKATRVWGILVLGFSMGIATTAMATEKQWTMEELVGLSQPQPVLTKEQKAILLKKTKLSAKEKKALLLANVDFDRYQFLNAEDDLILASSPNGIDTSVYEPTKKLGEFFIGVKGQP